MTSELQALQLIINFLHRSVVDPKYIDAKIKVESCLLSTMGPNRVSADQLRRVKLRVIVYENLLLFFVLVIVHALFI